MATTLALAGDTMLGRGVAESLERAGPAELFAGEIRDLLSEADLFVLNLECCVSDRGEPWRDPAKAFLFRAPPVAVEALALIGVDCVTLANNHALDYGAVALADTTAHLAGAGIAAVGAGATQAQARAPAVLTAGAVRVGVLGVTDHPPSFAAGPERPGVAFADLAQAVPGWLGVAVRGLREAVDIVLVSPHWGPNMAAQPVAHVRAAARALVASGATLVAGHSAHVFHAAAGPVLYDLGDFIDDYAVDALLRNDLGLVFLVKVDEQGPLSLTAVPIALDFCFTRLARGGEYAWVRDRFVRACETFGTEVTVEGGRLVAELR
ncbi:MAG: CapA family protein [Carbonactinosporaceae bacterium]